MNLNTTISLPWYARPTNAPLPQVPAVTRHHEKGGGVFASGPLWINFCPLGGGNLNDIYVGFSSSVSFNNK